MNSDPPDPPCNSHLSSSGFLSAVTLLSACILCQMLSRPPLSNTFHMGSCGTFRLGFLQIHDTLTLAITPNVMVPTVKNRNETPHHHRGCEPSTSSMCICHLVATVPSVTPNALESYVTPRTQGPSPCLQLLSAWNFYQPTGPGSSADTAVLTHQAEVPPQEEQSQSHWLGGPRHPSRVLPKCAALYSVLGHEAQVWQPAPYVQAVGSFLKYGMW